MNLGVSIIHKLLIDCTRLFENQLEPIERCPFQMPCRTPDIFFRQLSHITIYMTEQMIKTGSRFSMQFLRRRPGIYEPVIERRINVRIEPLEFCKCLWLMRHHHAYPPSSQRNFVHIDIWRARSNLRSTSSCETQSWITDPPPIMGNALKNRTGLPVRSSCSFHFSAIVFILSFLRPVIIP